MTLVGDFKKQFGKETYETILKNVGHHSGSKIPETKKGKLAFGLLEIVDWQCCKYGDSPIEREKDIKNFLIRHKKELGNIKMEPPSYIGLLGGAYSFLKDAK